MVPLQFDRAVSSVWASFCLGALTIVLVCTQHVHADSGDLYGMIDAVQTECEYQALTWGSRLGDAFNALDESAEWKQRFVASFFGESPSFAKLLHAEMARRATSFEGISVQHHHSAKHRLGSPAFASVDNKWVYLLGDSSLFPVWDAFQSGALAYGKKSESERTEECSTSTVLPPRKTSSKRTISITANGPAAKIVDAQACTTAGFGSGKLTFERRDLLMEDLTDSFFSAHPTFSVTSPQSVPDVLIVQPGYHTCTIAHIEPFRDEDKWEKNAESTGRTLMAALQTLQTQRPTMRVIVSLPGRHFFNETSLSSAKWNAGIMGRELDWIDYCLWRQNGILMFLAHQHHLPVIAREEIEHRLLLKTEHFYGTVDMEAMVQNTKDVRVLQVHHSTRTRLHDLVTFPGAQIVAAALVEMLHCFDKNQTMVI